LGVEQYTSKVASLFIKDGSLEIDPFVDDISGIPPARHVGFREATMMI
jgi:hypothetical protein